MQLKIRTVAGRPIRASSLPGLRAAAITAAFALGMPGSADAEVALPAPAAGVIDAVRARARALVRTPYDGTQGRVSGWLSELRQAPGQSIRFRGQPTLWGEQSLPIRVQFLHPGYLFDRTVERLQRDDEERNAACGFIRRWQTLT
jgi:glucan biosynthesis protein